MFTMILIADPLLRPSPVSIAFHTASGNNAILWSNLRVPFQSCYASSTSFNFKAYGPLGPLLAKYLEGVLEGTWLFLNEKEGKIALYCITVT